MKPSTPEDFWKRVDKSGECWMWLGPTVGGGYGRLSWHGNMVLAHRLSYELTHGQIRQMDLIVLHSCDNPACVRPEHLRLGTYTDNNLDSVARGRFNSALRAANSTHPYKPKLSAAQRNEIRSLAGKFSQRALARKFGVSHPTIADVLRGKTVYGRPR